MLSIKYCNLDNAFCKNISIMAYDVVGIVVGTMN